MQLTGSSKYLQLPANDSSDIGKPSPLALLAATCQRIGSKAPSHSPRQRPITPTPVLSKPASQPKREPSPLVSIPPVDRETTAETKTCKSPATMAYQLPLTPPSSPPQAESKVSSPAPRMTSAMPVPVSTPNERLSYTVEHPCHRPLQPVLHLPSLHYSPFTMVVPPSSIIAPYSGCVNQYCCTQHLPAVHPMLLPSAPLLPPASLSPPLSFGTYLHHDVEPRMSSAGKIQSHHAVKSTGHLYRPYEFPKHQRKPVAEEEIIDVVSV